MSLALLFVTACGSGTVEEGAIGRLQARPDQAELKTSSDPGSGTNAGPDQEESQAHDEQKQIAWPDNQSGSGPDSTATVPSNSSTTSAPTTTISGPITTIPAPQTQPAPTIGGIVQNPALTDAMAASVTPGGGGLARLVGSSAQARCIADRAVADIGEQRFQAAYGITVSSLQSGTSLLGVAYDQIDAEAMAAALASCVNLPAVLHRVFVADQMDPAVSTCVTTEGRWLFQQMFVAELRHDRGLVEKIVNELEDLAEACTYPDITQNPAPDIEPEPGDGSTPGPETDPIPEPNSEPEPEPEPEPAPEPEPPAPADEVQP